MKCPLKGRLFVHFSDLTLRERMGKLLSQIRPQCKIFIKKYCLHYRFCIILQRMDAMEPALKASIMYGNLDHFYRRVKKSS